MRQGDISSTIEAAKQMEANLNQKLEHAFEAQRQLGTTYIYIYILGTEYDAMLNMVRYPCM